MDRIREATFVKTDVLKPAAQKWLRGGLCTAESAKKMAIGMPQTQGRRAPGAEQCGLEPTADGCSPPGAGTLITWLWAHPGRGGAWVPASTSRLQNLPLPQRARKSGSPCLITDSEEQQCPFSKVRAFSSGTIFQTAF